MTRSMMLLLTLAVFILGCGKAEPPAEDVTDAEIVNDGEAFNAFFDKARAHFQEGDTDAAVDLLTEGLADPQFVGNQPTIFRALMEVLLIENRVVDAQTNFIAMLHASPDTAAQAFNMIPAHLKRAPDPSGYLSWCAQMVEMELPSGIVESAYSFYVDANVVAGNVDKLEHLTKEALSRFGVGGAVRVLTRPLNDLVEKGTFEEVRSVLDVLTATGDEAALNFVTGMKISLAAAEGKWDSVVAMFKATATGLPDNASRQALKTACGRAMKVNRGDVVDQLCEHVMTAMPDAQATRGQAIALYLGVAEKAQDYDKVVSRLMYLKDAGASDQLQQKISGVFYKVMNKASAASRKSMLELVEALLDDDRGSAQLQAFLMDGAVLNDDFRLALKVLDSGFRADDEAWVAMARNKLAAHLALQEGRTDDAVTAFRDFMKHVETWTDTTVDPSTGIAHTREMSLGFNAKRIGHIYRDAGRDDDAAKAYAEARDYFDQAMKKAKEDSREAAYITEQLADLPDMKPAPSL